MGSQIALAGVRELPSRPDFLIVEPTGPVRVTQLADGLYADGWLAAQADVSLWPDRPGERLRGALRLTLSMPAGTEAIPLRLRGDGVSRDVVVEPGKQNVVEFPVDARAVVGERHHRHGRLRGRAPGERARREAPVRPRDGGCDHPRIPHRGGLITRSGWKAARAARPIRPGHRFAPPTRRANAFEASAATRS